MYGRKCISLAMQNKMYANYHSQSQRNVPSNPTAMNPSCLENIFTYIEQIHNNIKDYYNQSNIYIWATFSSLSGKYVLTNKFKESPEMDELKYVDIKVNENSYTLDAFYFYYLPFNLNWMIISTFQRTIFFHINKRKNIFFYQYTIMVQKYLQIKNIKIDNDKLKKIKESLEFKTFTIFNNLFSVTGIYKSYIDDDSIITRIQESNENNISNILKEKFPLYIEKELNDWSNNEFNQTNPDKLRSILREKAVENCTKGIKYLNAFKSYLNQSTPTYNDPSDMLSSDNCLDREKSIFII